jgi:hypothetical protein
MKRYFKKLLKKVKKAAVDVSQTGDPITRMSYDVHDDLGGRTHYHT